jgi:hypothetical protein
MNANMKIDDTTSHATCVESAAASALSGVPIIDHITTRRRPTRSAIRASPSAPNALSYTQAKVLAIPDWSRPKLLAIHGAPIPNIARVKPW